MTYLKIVFIIFLVLILIFLLTKIINNNLDNLNVNKKTYNIAICFYGLTRSLKYTIKNIEQNIFKPLKDANINYDVILHTYDLKHIKSKRSKENNKLDTNEWKLLKPNYYQIDNQDEFDKSYDYKFVKSYGDAWNSKFENTINLVRQLNSLKKVWLLSKKNKNKYDCYLLLRPDLLYINKININQIKEAAENKNSAYTPSWQTWGGKNDRMALGHSYSISKIANRIDDIKDYLKKYKKPLHAERFLKFIFNKYDIKGGSLDLKGLRVRSNGNISRLDKKLL